ncbi:iron-containing alcohol dehydrogenase [Paracoccus yeei]|uniref:Alcohol dehydrogenase 2 n=1 Tax=Paracoccus yeei TaxID=147645 RepID=A0A5P2QVW4_9RHOB|nr:iron-containing alcohol dehydrogenase [Paracoccus yeei]QEU09499.1 iron-containing alcohol dehydrogenase [Paracoccus yeei]
MIYQSALPRILRIGPGASSDLGAVLTALGYCRPFVITDSFMNESGRLQALLHDLAADGISAQAFWDTVPEPTLSSIDRALEALKAADADCVVGFGGGSPIDSAKAVAVLAAHGGDLRRFKAPALTDAPGLPIIALPTTAGTGSEATRFTIITDDASDEKMLCAGLAFLPVAALVDYELTLTMPPRLTADTGIDALTHAIEAYVSRRANPFSDGFALSAMQAIAPNLRRAYAQPQNRAAREAMMFGATLAGIAFSNSSVALVHGMSRPIGAHFHVAHGLSNAMLLPTVTAWSAPAAPARYADCARAMGIATRDDNDDGAVEKLIAELRALNADLAVPTPAAHGIAPERWEALLPVMAEQAVASGSPANNPLTPSAEEIVAIYRQVWAA